MQVKIDEATWEQFVANNLDDYGSTVVSFAIRWAESLEVVLGNGESLRRNAARCAKTAKLQELNDRQRTLAVAVLAWAWPHGIELREWYARVNNIPMEAFDTNIRP